MRLYYLDASAWVKRYCAEDGSDRLDSFFAAAPAIGCAALGLIEVLCTLTRKQRAGEMTAHDARTMCRHAQSDFEWFYKVFLTPTLSARACRLAKTHGLRGADTVHLAACLELAERAPDRFREVRLIAADRELLDGAAECGLQTANPEEANLL